MADKPRRGRPPKAENEKRRNTINVRLDDPAYAEIEEATKATGRSLSGEIQHRLADYESMRGLVNRLLDDRATINVAVGMEGIRRNTVKPVTIGFDENLPSLERAIQTAACMSHLFKTVADHACDALAPKATAALVDAWTQRREAGDLEDDFDIEKMASVLSAEIVDASKKWGKSIATTIAPTFGPNIWDVCFEKDDPLRSAGRGAGYGLMGTLRGSNVGLPPSFLPPLPTEKERLASMKKLKDGSVIRDAARHQISEGKHPGKSEDEVIEILYDDLMTFKTDLAAPDVTTG